MVISVGNFMGNNYTPSDDEEYMNPRQLDYFRSKLMSWREELLEDSKKAIENLIHSSMNESDVTDRANMETDTFCELSNRDRNRKLISKIEDALRRIDTGEYGYCEETGARIGIRRLQARLVATLCIEAQENHERYKRQHSEDDDGAAGTV